MKEHLIVFSNVEDYAPPLAGPSVETGGGFMIRVTLPPMRLVAAAVSRLVRSSYFNLEGFDLF